MTSQDADGERLYLFCERHPFLYSPQIRISRGVDSLFVTPDDHLVELCLDLQGTLVGGDLGFEVNNLGFLGPSFPRRLLWRCRHDCDDAAVAIRQLCGSALELATPKISSSGSSCKQLPSQLRDFLPLLRTIFSSFSAFLDGILTFANPGVPKRLCGLDRSVVVDAAGEEVWCRLGDVPRRASRFDVQHWLRHVDSTLFRIWNVGVGVSPEPWDDQHALGEGSLSGTRSTRLRSSSL